MNIEFRGIYNKIYNSFYLICLTLFILNFVNFEITIVNYLNLITVGLLLILFLIYIFFIGIERKKVPLFIILILGLMSFFYNNIFQENIYEYYDLTVIFSTILLITYRNNNKNLLKYSLIWKVFLVSVVISLNIIGVFGDVNYYSQSGRLRQSLGFLNPNNIALFVLIITFEILYLIKNKKVATYNFFALILLILNVVIFYLVGSRTVFIISILLILSIVFTKNILKYNNKIKSVYVTSSLFSIICISTFLILYLDLNDRIVSLINKVLSGRIEMSQFFNENFGISFLGVNVPSEKLVIKDYIYYKTWDNFLIDNSYVRTLIMYGVLFSFVSLLTILKYISKASWTTYDFIIIIFVVIYGISERYNLNVILFTLILPLIFNQMDRADTQKESIVISSKL